MFNEPFFYLQFLTILDSHVILLYLFFHQSSDVEVICNVLLLLIVLQGLSLLIKFCTYLGLISWSGISGSKDMYLIIAQLTLKLFLKT